MLWQSKPGVHNSTCSPAFIPCFLSNGKQEACQGREGREGRQLQTQASSWQASRMWLQGTSGPPSWKTVPCLTLQMHLCASKLVLCMKFPHGWLESPNNWLCETCPIFHWHSAVLLHWQTHSRVLGMWFLLLLLRKLPWVISAMTSRPWCTTTRLPFCRKF